MDMDVLIADENGNPGVVMQHYELTAVLEYAKAWAGITNDPKRKEVLHRIKDVDDTIKQWLIEMKKVKQ